MASEEARVEAWRRKFAIDDLWAGAEPGRGHRALAALARGGKLAAIVTQNIDGLQQAADFPENRLIELHGNGTYAVCLVCEATHDLAHVRDEFERSGRAPSCPCGGIVKAATISFGQAMPQLAWRRALQETLACDLFLAIGSSLVVHPAAQLPRLAKQNGARLVIVNRDPTPLDGIADLVATGDIATILEPLTPRQDSYRAN
jgi:NAD-dependent deacetylase